MTLLVTNRILHGDALVQLKTLPDDSIDCVVTSPPYWALRDYGITGQLGTEPHFKDYIEKLAAIFDEVYRVLKPSGTCFVNLGDTFSNYKIGHTDRLHAQKIVGTQQQLNQLKRKTLIQRKSLCCVPFRFAIAMVERRWILRNTIIWHKPNAIPQSVKDRFTVDYEYVFFFTKSAHYYFEQQFEPMNAHEAQYRHDLRKTRRYQVKTPFQGQPLAPNIHVPGRNKRCVWSICTKPNKSAHVAPYPEALIETPIVSGCPEGGVVLDPFLGSGTTAKVAQQLGRHYIGIDINPEYIALAEAHLSRKK